METCSGCMCVVCVCVCVVCMCVCVCACSLAVSSVKCPAVAWMSGQV